MKSAVFLCMVVAATASAEVNIEFRPVASTINLGDTAQVGLYATWDGSGLGETASVIEVAFGWDTSFLSLLGLDGTGGATLLSSGFPAAGSGGLNEAALPADGDGFYLAFASLGSPIDTTVAGGTLVTTFLFQGLNLTPGTPIDMFTSAGSPIVETRVFDGVIPNTVVTGTLTGTSIAIIPSPAGLALFGVSAMCIRRPRRS
jgi:hypothetical protein